jgi:hypothetical protein
MSKESPTDTWLQGTAKYLAGATFGGLATLALSAFQEAGTPVLAALEQAATKRALLHSALFLLLSNAAAWFLLWRERVRASAPLTERFRFNPSGGFYVDPKTGDAVCPSCLGRGVILHMMASGGGRLCHACQTTCPDGDGRKD